MPKSINILITIISVFLLIISVLISTSFSHANDSLWKKYSNHFEYNNEIVSQCHHLKTNYNIKK